MTPRPILVLATATALLAACSPPPPLTESAFESVDVARIAWLSPEKATFVPEAAREARQDLRSTLALEVREADDENQRGVIFVQYVNRPPPDFGTGGQAQRFDRGLPPSVAGVYSEEGQKREVVQAGGTVVSSRAFDRARETSYRDRNGDSCIMVGRGQLRDPAQGEAGGFDFVSHGILCGPADTRAAFSSYVRGGSVAPRVVRVDGEAKELKLPALPKIPCPIPVLCK